MQNKIIIISENKAIDLDTINEDQILELAIGSLKKPGPLRTPDDILLLRKATKNNSFFTNLIQKYGEETYNSIFQFLSYQYLEPDTTLFNAGSMGTTFYIILKGHVGVILKIPINKEDGTIEFNLKEIKILGAGDSFGELAIMEDITKPRAASINSKEVCHLACLDKASYKKIIGLHQKRELDSKIEFLSSIPVFKSWSNHSLKTLTYIISIKHFSIKQVIYREGDPVDEIYVTRSGEVKSLKSVRINRLKKDSEQLGIDEQNQVYTYSKDPLVKVVELAVITAGQLFGEEEAFLSYQKEKDREVLMKSNVQTNVLSPSLLATMDPISNEPTKRETTVVCNSLQAEIWAIQKKSFFEKLEPYSGSYNLLVSIVNKKIQWKFDRLEELAKLTSTNINFLVGNSPIKTKPSENSDLVSTIKYKNSTRHQNHTLIKSNPTDIIMIQSESSTRCLNAGLNDSSMINDSNANDYPENIETLHNHNESINTNRGKIKKSLTNIISDERSFIKIDPFLYTEDNEKHKIDEEKLIPQSNGLNSALRKVIIAENPNIKFWDLNIISISNLNGSSRDTDFLSSSHYEKNPISSLKCRPVYHDRQNMLTTAMNNKKKIQEKLKNASFAIKGNYNNNPERRDYNPFNTIIFKKEFKTANTFIAPIDHLSFNNEINNEKNKNFRTSIEDTDLGRLIRILKSKPAPIKIEDETSSKNDIKTNNNNNVFRRLSKKNIRILDNISYKTLSPQRMATYQFGDQNPNSYGINSLYNAKNTIIAPSMPRLSKPDKHRTLSVNSADNIGKSLIGPITIVREQGQNNLNISTLNTQLPDVIPNKKFNSIRNGEFSRHQANLDTQYVAIKSRLLDKESSLETKHLRLKPSLKKHEPYKMNSLYVKRRNQSKEDNNLGILPSNAAINKMGEIIKDQLILSSRLDDGAMKTRTELQNKNEINRESNDSDFLRNINFIRGRHKLINQVESDTNKKSFFAINRDLAGTPRDFPLKAEKRGRSLKD